VKVSRKARKLRVRRQSAQGRSKPSLLPALVAMGGACGLAAAPASALELGDIRVNSTLGEPLRASIAYALNANERIGDHCIFIRPGAAGSGIPGISRATVSVTDNAILIAGTQAVREPMLSLQLAVDCQYTPRLLRDYTILIDPVLPANAVVPSSSRTSGNTQQTPVSTNRTTAAPRVQPSTQRPEPIASARTTVSQRSGIESPIAMNSQYQVRVGDTLSTIAARIEGRSVRLWPAVDMIFSANPHAFANADVNQLMAGSVLDIPSLTQGMTIAEATAPVVQRSTTTTTVANAAPAEAVSETAAEVVSSVAPATGSALPETTLSVDQSRDIRPGDLVMPPAVSSTTNIPDTQIDNGAPVLLDPAEASQSPVVASTNTTSATTAEPARSWVFWLGGAGIVLILALLAFGRIFKGRFGDGKAADVAPMRRHDDDPTQEAQVIEGVDYEFEDTINSRAISLDADLEAGTGLSDSSAMDVAQDFGFTATSENDSAPIDLEFSDEAVGSDEDKSATDVIPPNHKQAEDTILDSEDTLPGVEVEEYDLSMVVDATRQPIAEAEVTAKDLQAVQIDSDTKSDADDTGDYTLTKEIDYKLLEQDYEEEFTATMALNAEMEKAARELAKRVGEDLEETGNMPGTEVTVEMPSAKTVDDDKTSVLPSSMAVESEKTRRMPSSKDELELPEMSDPSNTAELAVDLPSSLDALNDEVADDEEASFSATAAGSDVTVDMQVESGKIDTGKKKS